MAKTPTLLDNLEKELLNKNFERRSKKSYDWLQRKSKEFSNTRILQKEIIKDQTKTGNVLKSKYNNSHIGKLFMYAYDPKHKETLDYYDMFPLMFLIDVYPDGSFTGLNLHYLPPKYRAILFDKLISTANNKRFDNTTKLKLSYEMLRSTTRFKLFSPCFKKYLPNQLRSRVLTVSPNDWDLVLFLPLAQFKKASQAKVWSDSLEGK